MLKLGLLTMPETLLAFPSIGLTEISSVLKKEFAGQIEVEIYYPCLEYAKFLGVETYLEFQSVGLNQWMFRKEAFPDAADYIEKLEERYFSQGKGAARKRVWNRFLEQRENIIQYLDIIIEKYHLLECDVVGMSSTFSQNIASFALARRIKQKRPECIVMMGGANCEYPMGNEIIKHMEDIDYVFSGLGIVSFTKFVDCLLKKDDKGINKINGIFSKKNHVAGEMAVVPDDEDYTVGSHGDAHDINMCIDLDYDEFLNEYEQFCKETGYAHKPVILFETSRGCWKRDALPCTFCGLNLPNTCFQSMKPEIAKGYIQNIIDKYADKCEILSCVDNILDKHYIKEVLPFLKVPSGVSLVYEINSALSKEELMACKEAGITIVQPGVESLNTKELKLMQKGITSFINISFLKRCIEIGIYPIWNYLYKVPGNSDESNYSGISEMLPRLRHLPPPTGTAPIGFHKLSPFTENAKKYGLKLVPDPSYADIYPFDEESIKKIAFFFLDETEDADYKRIADKYSMDIGMEILEWVSSFKIDEELPKLYFLDESNIFDSRFDTDNTEIYEISVLEYKLLKYLERPMSFEQILLVIKDEEEDDIFEAMENLEDMQLLFSEDERYISLVCEKCSWTKAGFDQRTELLELTTTRILS